MGKLCLGCGQEPESVEHHGGQYIVCGQCYADGCELYKQSGIWMFLRKNGDVERAAERRRDVCQYPMLGTREGDHARTE